MAESEETQTGVGAVGRRQFLRQAGMLTGALGLASTGSTQVASAGEETPASEERRVSPFPTLSNHERDWRWQFLRQLMRDHKVDCLLVPPGQQASIYVANDSPGQTVIFPLEGEPLAVGKGASDIGTWLEAVDRGESSWVQEWPTHPAVETIIEILQERGLASSRIGSIGAPKGELFSSSAIGYFFWAELRRSPPQVLWRRWKPICCPMALQA